MATHKSNRVPVMIGAKLPVHSLILHGGGECNRLLATRNRSTTNQCHNPTVPLFADTTCIAHPFMQPL